MVVEIPRDPVIAAVRARGTMAWKVAWSASVKEPPYRAMSVNLQETQVETAAWSVPVEVHLAPGTDVKEL